MAIEQYTLPTHLRLTEPYPPEVPPLASRPGVYLCTWTWGGLDHPHQFYNYWDGKRFHSGDGSVEKMQKNAGRSPIVGRDWRLVSWQGVTINRTIEKV